MITPLFWDQEMLPTRQFIRLNVAQHNNMASNIVQKGSTVNEDISMAYESEKTLA
jgi:hypothetical protein